MSKRKQSMTQAAASRIQSAEAKANHGVVQKGSFAARAQSAADRQASGNNQPNWPSKTGNPSGPNRDNNPPKNN